MLYVTRTSTGVWSADAANGPWVRREQAEWLRLFTESDAAAYLTSLPAVGEAVDAPDGAPAGFVVDQEVWAAGVTYYRSRTARMEESEDAGGGSFYDKVYEAERPEIFFKATARTTVAPGEPVRIRSDSAWNVPEPELVLAVNNRGQIIGYTSGNDMSSRDIEGANPLYLPQAKVYSGSCSIGPTLALTQDPIDRTTAIALEVNRGGKREFAGTTTLTDLKRSPDELVRYLFKDQSFPDGVFLMTGTGIVPGDDFTLKAGDTIRITIGDLAPLENTVAEE